MRCTKALSPLVTGLTMLALSTEALAAPDEERKDVPRRYRTSEILNRMEIPRSETRSWLEEHIAIRKGVGLVYRYKLETDGDRKVILSVGGPALKKKRLGLMFEVRF